MKKREVDSPAVAMLRLVWDNAQKEGGFSWERLNHSLAGILSIAVGAGLHFDVDDFRLISDQFDFHHWCGVNNAQNSGEGFYGLAIAVGNTSAARAWEHFRKRPAFIANHVRNTGAGGYQHGGGHARKRGRLGLGFYFPWKGHSVVVTSFAVDGTYLTACTYKKIPEAPVCPECHRCGYSYHRREIARRFTITPVDLKREHPAPKRKKDEVTT